MNTAEEIRAHLGSLELLRQLSSQRHRLGYDDGKTLNEFIILKGRYYLDSCGNFSKVRELEGNTQNLKDVMTREELYAALGPNGSMTTDIGTPLPGERQQCAVCGHFWTVANCHDFLNQDGQTYHENCLRLDVAQQEFEHFQSMFKLAGFKTAIFTAIPNGYWGERAGWYGTPWYIVETPYGKIKIGWRKRVINIDWSDTGKDLELFFKNEDVTKWNHGIHAWSSAKAVSYLATLHGLLSKTEEGLARVRQYAEERTQ